MTPIKRRQPFPSRRLAWSTAIFSAATGLSRVLGLFREIVARGYFGVEGAGINAFTIAFQVPNLVRALVADAALTSAFVPVFSELLEKGERARAWRVASSLIWILLLGLTAVTALFMLATPWVMDLFGYGEGGGEPRGDSVPNSLSDRGHARGLRDRRRDPQLGLSTSPSATPVFWNLAIIAGLVIGVPRADSTEGELVYAEVDRRRHADQPAPAVAMADRARRQDPPGRSTGAIRP